MFTGGLQRVAQLTVNEYENEKKREEERKSKIEQRRLEIENDDGDAASNQSGSMSISKQLGKLTGVIFSSISIIKLYYYYGYGLLLLV